MKKYPIGFNTRQPEDNTSVENKQPTAVPITPRKSVVRIYFPERNMSLSYYNDLFDLHCGDLRLSLCSVDKTCRRFIKHYDYIIMLVEN